jgi:putative holliday junction resolvase
LAVDVGTVRIGLALSDREAIIATPLPAIRRTQDLAETVNLILGSVEADEILEIYVGNPISLSGKDTASTADALAFAEALAASASSAIRMIDERLTTVSAAAKLRQAGVSSRNAKELIDSASAVEILESALQAERASGNAPGKLLEVADGS